MVMTILQPLGVRQYYFGNAVPELCVCEKVPCGDSSLCEDTEGCAVCLRCFVLTVYKCVQVYTRSTNTAGRWPQRVFGNGHPRFKESLAQPPKLSFSRESKGGHHGCFNHSATGARTSRRPRGATFRVVG